jgi:protein involved in polysaccharide export with SLBB domain
MSVETAVHSVAGVGCGHGQVLKQVTASVARGWLSTLMICVELPAFGTKTVKVAPPVTTPASTPGRVAGFARIRCR